GYHSGTDGRQRGPAGLVPERLTGRGDEGQVVGGGSGCREELQDGGGEALAQRDVQQREILRAAARDRIDDLPALGRGVWFLVEGDQLGLEGIIGQPHQRRGHAVERRARHHADG